MKRILFVSDCVISPAMYREYFAFAWEQYEVEMVEDLKGYTDIDFQKLMLGTEQNGPEAYEANPEIADKIKDADILVMHMSVINRKILDAAQRLKAIFVCRGGCDNLNVAYAKEKGIFIANAASRSADSVADFTVAMMVSEMKSMIRSAIALHDGEWKKEFANVGHCHNLRKQTVGIIGFGEIGVRVAQRLAGFGCNIIVHDPFLTPEVVRERGGKPVSLEELLTQSDIVTLHLRLSESTFHFIGRKELEKMKETAYFVNNARSGLVDQEALLEALQQKKIMGAALDVFDVEPLPMDHPFRSLDNVSLTPHMAGVSCDTVINGIELMAEALKQYAE